MGVKESLLAAGVMLLREKGFAALTQPQVAAAAGVKQSHLTYYFPTRNDLLLAIAEHTVDTLLAEAATHLAASPKGQTLTDIIIRVMLEGVPPRVIVGLIAASDTDPAIRQSLTRLINQVRMAVPAILMAAGLRVTPDDVLMFHATLVGLAIMHQARLSDESAAEVRVGVTALIERLSVKPPSVQAKDIPHA
ncbi:TetR/AcrR family transcriptional regulator [Chitinivorax sp. B]|uniref:TetR/AcrR family transcriptional regulator n=1 Tax=Chitinivorax sp. B TaxID=2502235 RepID=UPI0010F80A71|nr:TetR/AcrR family transcriptional regulator [Chitinivorax sp. B]